MCALKRTGNLKGTGTLLSWRRSPKRVDFSWGAIYTWLAAGGPYCVSHFSDSQIFYAKVLRAGSATRWDILSKHRRRRSAMAACERDARRKLS